MTQKMQAIMTLSISVGKLAVINQDGSCIDEILGMFLEVDRIYYESCYSFWTFFLGNFEV